MPEPRNLLQRLLDYIGEQAKDIDPRGYRLDAVKGFLRRPSDIAGLPGIETDIKVAGDHIWLRIPRLVGTKPRGISENFKGLIRVSDDPNGAPPAAEEAAFLHYLTKTTEGKTEEERTALEAAGRPVPELAGNADCAIPRLSEPWYCCAEPTDQQLQSF